MTPKRPKPPRIVHAEAHDADNLISFATRGRPLCGAPLRIRWTPPDSTGKLVTRMSDTWRGVTCKRCLARKPKRRKRKDKP